MSWLDVSKLIGRADSRVSFAKDLDFSCESLGSPAIILPTYYYYLHPNLPLSSLSNPHLQPLDHRFLSLIIIIPAAIDCLEILMVWQDFLREKGLSEGKFARVRVPFLASVSVLLTANMISSVSYAGNIDPALLQS
jgi:hypothetical protein